MKNLLHSLWTVPLMLVCISNSIAQAPEKVSYQAVVRYGNDALVSNSQVGVRISLLKGSTSGTLVFLETHTPTTNANGLLSIEIGGGSNVSGSIASINWADGPYYIKTETDPNGGTAYNITATTQLLSVPYALYAKTAGNNTPGPQGVTGSTGPQGLIGSTGPQGLAGPTGSQGIVGATGSVGAQGATGPKGSTGFQGIQGIAGSTGPAGSQGNAGSIGATGPQGSQGIAGSTGPSGPQGVQGIDGPTGPSGPQGTAGINGTTGNTGSRGPTGPTGTGGGNSWNLTGNGGIVDTLNFIGTTSGHPLNFRVNNKKAGRISGYLPGKGETYLGFQSGQSSTGLHNIAYGVKTLYSNTNGSYNSAVGSHSMYSNSSGLYNTAVGHHSLYTNTVGYHNVAIGYMAMKYTTTGDSNVAIGSEAMLYNSTGTNNVAIGRRSMVYNSSGYNNVGIGVAAMFRNSTGNRNTALGYHAFKWNMTGLRNVSIGANSMKGSFSASNNCAVGFESMKSIYSGQYNTAMGYQALFTTGIGNSNVAIGFAAAYLTLNGNSNVAIGRQALVSNTNGSQNTAVGYLAYSSGTLYNNSTAIGYNSTITASSQVRIGSSGASSIGGQVGWTTLSDGRFKENVSENVPGLSFISQLRPVTYTVNKASIEAFIDRPDSLRVEVKEDHKIYTGFIAQEVEEAANNLNYRFSGVDEPKNANDYYGLRYGEFTVPLVKAIQEQQEMIKALKRQNEALIKRIEALETQ